MSPGSLEGLQLVVAEIEVERDALAAGGVEVLRTGLPVGRFVFFADPDGNRWGVQEIVPPNEQS